MHDFMLNQYRNLTSVNLDLINIMANNNINVVSFYKDTNCGFGHER